MSPTPGTWTEPRLGTTAQYSYTGNPFTSADPPWTTSDRVTGSLEITAELGPFVQVADLAPFIVDYSFADGVQTRTPANSTVCAARVGTDGAGGIADWAFTFRETPSPAPGDPQQSIDFSRISGDSVGTGPAGTDVCSAFIYTTMAHTEFPGSWSNGGAPALPVDYDYEGELFDTVQGVYTVDDRVVGSVQIAGELPPDLPPSNIAYALLDYSFTDGVQTRTPANTFVCSFDVATNALGEISEWTIFLRETSINPGDPQESLASTNPSVSIYDQGTLGPAGPGVCDTYIATDFGTSPAPGTWTRRGGTSVVEVPTLATPGILTLVSLLALVGLVRMRRATEALPSADRPTIDASNDLADLP